MAILQIWFNDIVNLLPGKEIECGLAAVIQL